MNQSLTTCRKVLYNVKVELVMRAKCKPQLSLKQVSGGLADNTKNEEILLELRALFFGLLFSSLILF